MSIKGQGHSFTLVKVHSDFKVKCLTFGLYTQVSDSGPLGPLVLKKGTVSQYIYFLYFMVYISCLQLSHYNDDCYNHHGSEILTSLNSWAGWSWSHWCY